MLNRRLRAPSARDTGAAVRFFAALLVAPAAFPQSSSSPLDAPWLPDVGKLPLTAGFNDIDGAGGGGLVPWALITGYGTDESWGANVHDTEVLLRDFRLRSYGAAVEDFRPR